MINEVMKKCGSSNIGGERQPTVQRNEYPQDNLTQVLQSFILFSPLTLRYVIKEIDAHVMLGENGQVHVRSNLWKLDVFAIFKKFYNNQDDLMRKMIKTSNEV